MACMSELICHIKTIGIDSAVITEFMILWHFFLMERIYFMKCTLWLCWTPTKKQQQKNLIFPNHVQISFDLHELTWNYIIYIHYDLEYYTKQGFHFFKDMNFIAIPEIFWLKPNIIFLLWFLKIYEWNKYHVYTGIYVYIKNILTN